MDYLSEASIRARARALREKIRRHDEFPAQLIEVENENGVSSVRVNDDDNKVWIIAYDDNARPAQAWNLITQYRAGAPVWVRRMPNNTLEVVRLRGQDSSDLYGLAAPTLNFPDLIGDVMPNTGWPGRSLLPGRLRSTDAGGLLVYVEPFHYDGGYFPGDTYNLTPHVPSTADKKAWVKIWVDPALNALGLAAIGATAGAEVDLIVTMDQRDLAAVAIDPSYIPVAGVILTNGDTTINEGMVYDARQWIGAATSQSPTLTTPTFTASTTLDGISSGFANAQEVTLQAGLRTTDDTVTTIASIVVPESRGIVMRAAVIGVKDDHSEACGGDILYMARRASGGNVTEIAAATIRQAEDSGAGPPAISGDVDTGTQTMRIRVQGIPAVNYDWVVTYSYHFVASNA